MAADRALKMIYQMWYRYLQRTNLTSGFYNDTSEEIGRLRVSLRILLEFIFIRNGKHTGGVQLVVNVYIQPASFELSKKSMYLYNFTPYEMQGDVISGQKQTEVYLR